MSYIRKISIGFPVISGKKRWEPSKRSYGIKETVAGDHDEMVNLINSEEYAEIRNKLHDKILDWMNNTRDPFRGYYWERRPWRTDATEPTWGYTSMTRQREEDEGEERQLDYNTGLEMVSAVRKK